MVEVSFHPHVQRDLAEIVEWYRREGGDRLADRFVTEAGEMVEALRRNASRFHFVDEPFRRANFRNFPHHYIFEITLTGVRITVLKHHRRNPQYGGKRRQGEGVK